MPGATLEMRVQTSNISELLSSSSSEGYFTGCTTTPASARAAHMRSLLTKARAPRDGFLLRWQSWECWERLSRRGQYLCISGLSLITIAVSMYPWLRGKSTCNANNDLKLNSCSSQGCDGADTDLWELESSPRLYGAHTSCSYLMVGALLTYVSFISRDRLEVSVLEQLVGWCIFHGWLCTTCFAIQRALSWCESSLHMMLVSKMFQAFGVSFYIRFMFLYMLALQKRVQLMEVSFGARLCSWIIRRVRQFALLLGLLYLAVTTYLAVLYLSVLHGTQQANAVSKLSLRACAVHNLTLATSFLVIAFISIAALDKVRAALELPAGYARHISAFASQEARWAYKILGRLRWMTALPCVVQATMAAEQALVHILETELEHPIRWINLRGFSPFAQALGIIVDVACIFLFFGILKQKDDRDIGFARTHSLQADQGRRARTYAQDWMPARSSSSAGWCRKVRELAERSIDVCSLLKFYSALGPRGCLMAHFDPEKSTTNDVVRQAIIPASRLGQGGAAYSNIVPRRRFSTAADLPTRMVTHCWSNLFVHLVAAVVSDALDLDEYEDVSKALCHEEFEDIECELLKRGTLYRRYWICAFCVNQHSGICGGFDMEPPAGSKEYDAWDQKRRDTVSREIYPCCDCKQPKYFNDSPDECEMNKFDDMMAYLKDEVCDLRQVVAVDRDFELFVRAWCISELVQAHVSGIPQDVRLLTARVLGLEEGDLHIYRKLATLTVANCEASRPEDKADILSRIPDITIFDAKLQRIIFGDRGLLQQRLEGVGIWEAAVRVACRFKFLNESGTSTIRV